MNYNFDIFSREFCAEDEKGDCILEKSIKIAFDGDSMTERMNSCLNYLPVRGIIHEALVADTYRLSAKGWKEIHNDLCNDSSNYQLNFFTKGTILVANFAAVHEVYRNSDVSSFINEMNHNYTPPVKCIDKYLVELSIFNF